MPDSKGTPQLSWLDRIWSTVGERGRELIRLAAPGLKRFATLSPVPGFSKWLNARLDSQEAESPALLHPNEEQDLLAVSPAASAGEALKAITRQEAWWAEAGLTAVLQPMLLRLCAIYLTEERGGKGPADPVARFHLGNGARLESINWLGNTAAKGLAQSFGIMVNYLYDPDLIEVNHETFVKKGVVARSPEVEAVLHQPQRVRLARNAAALFLGSVRSKQSRRDPPWRAKAFLALRRLVAVPDDRRP